MAKIDFFAPFAAHGGLGTVRDRFSSAVTSTCQKVNSTLTGSIIFALIKLKYYILSIRSIRKFLVVAFSLKERYS